MQVERQPIDKFVDKYFLPHFYHHFQSQHNQASCTLRAPQCPLCLNIEHAKGQSESLRRQTLLTQDDIDLLQLLDPKTTPESYMRSIIHLCRREQNLRPRQNENEPMQLFLTTRRIIKSSRFFQPIPNAPDHSRYEGLDNNQQTRLQELDREQINRLRDQCYLGLGHMIVQRKEIEHKRGLSKTNYHTRQYLLPLVEEEVERLAQEGAARGQKKFYLLPNANSGGISFPADQMPASLSQVLECNRYRQIVCTLNAIIQQVVYHHRTSATRGRKMSAIYGWLWVLLLSLVILMVMNSLAVGSQALSQICLVGALCLIIFILMVSCHRYREEINFVSLVDLLNLKITDYLNNINSWADSKLYWKTEQRLYWIEITFREDS